MPDDAHSASLHTLSPLMAVLAPIAPRPDRQAFKTLFTCLDHDDAICAGWEEPEQTLGEGGGFAVHFDGRGHVPTVVLELQDGEIAGYHAIRELRKALEVAERMAARMTGREA